MPERMRGRQSTEAFQIHRCQCLSSNRAAPDLQAYLQGAYRRERLGRACRYAAGKKVRTKVQRVYSASG